MSERTLADALAHAQLKIAKVRAGLPVHIDEMDIAVLADEVLRLRVEIDGLKNQSQNQAIILGDLRGSESGGGLLENRNE